MTLGEAAKNLAMRHLVMTGEDQHIEKKTLDDYYSHIKAGNDSLNPYNFTANEFEMVKHLRKHCQDTKSMMWIQISHNSDRWIVNNLGYICDHRVLLYYQC